MNLCETLDTEDMLNLRECNFIESLGCPDPLKLEKVLGTEALSNTVPALTAHILTFLVQELIGSAFAARVGLVWTLGMLLLSNRFRF